MPDRQKPAKASRQIRIAPFEFYSRFPTGITASWQDDESNEIQQCIAELKLFERQQIPQITHIRWQ